MSAIQQILAGYGAGASAGQQVFTSSGTFSVPAGVTEICAVAVGKGGDGTSGNGYTGGNGGAGGTLSYANAISVTPGESLTVTVPATSSSSTGEASIKRSSTFLLAARAGGQTSGQANVGTAYAGGAGAAGDTSAGGGGGGAGGYAGAGTNGTNDVNSTAGSGGSASGGNSGGGGGVGLLGQGSSGAAASNAGRGGSGGADGGAMQAPPLFNPGATGGAYGGGGAGGGDGAGGAGGGGAVRIIWGAGRSYPSTNTGDV